MLLYCSQEKEYKQAKERAAEILKARILPSNRSVAEELDKLADEIEGSARVERLVQMRKEALSIMVILGEFYPRLVGSVWRGTAHKGSDIDVELFSSDPEKVVKRLRQNNLAVQRAKWHVVTKGDQNERAFHMYLCLQSGDEVEAIVRDPEKIDEMDKCEIYGDIIKGLNIHQLRKLLVENPYKKFVPK
jgi:predicted nucleotidyltransferase